MKNIIRIFCITICIVSCKDKVEKKSDHTTNPITISMDKHAEALLLDAKINAVSIGIYKDGKTYIGHYGTLDKGKNNPPTDETMYEIASVSKTFAGTLVAQAVLDGKIHLEDDIRKYLKEDYANLSYEDHPIRIKHLITHTARLPKFMPLSINAIFENIDEDLPFKIYEIEKNYNREKFFEDLHSIVIDTIPGTKYGYSNVDTELIAHILENIYEKTYEALLQEYIGNTAEMSHTKINLNDEEKQQLANGYGETNKKVPHLVNPLWGAAGGIKSTMPDLIQYMKFQLDENNPVVKESHRAIYKDKTMKIGYYWPINYDENEGTYYGHHGGAMGTQNWFFIIPKHSLGLSIITNQSDQETGVKLVKTINAILEDIR